MKRPIFLTIWLALMTLGDISSLYSYTLGTSAMAKALPNLPSWAFGVLTLLVVLQLVGVIMLWMWKKMGFYMFIASAIIAASVNGAILGAAGVGTSLFGVIGIAILYLAMKPVWQNFK